MPDTMHGAGKNADATNLFNKAYELYSLFWGINMGLVDVAGVKKDESMPAPLREWIGTAPADGASPANANDSRPAGTGAKKSMLSGLGEWVKKSVNCCIE